MGTPPLESAHLRALCYALGDTNLGLTGTEIGRLLALCGIDYPGEMTKRERLFQALSSRQSRDGSANNVLTFVEAALNPSSFANRGEAHTDLRESTNRALAFAGYFIADDGKVRRIAPARTVPEAIETASGLMSELIRRRIHPEVVKSCRSDLLQEDYVDAVFEAAKGVAEALRLKAGSTLDGWELVDYALGVGRKQLPRLALNPLRSETDWAEQAGLAALMKGVFSMYRNPAAHVPRTKRALSEMEALDALTIVSVLHRRVDELVSTSPKPPGT